MPSRGAVPAVGRCPVAGRWSPRFGMFLLAQVPVRTAVQRDRTWSGFVAALSVTHERGVAGGEYACTLDVTDVVMGWTETRESGTRARNMSSPH